MPPSIYILHLRTINKYPLSGSCAKNYIRVQRRITHTSLYFTQITSAYNIDVMLVIFLSRQLVHLFGRSGRICVSQVVSGLNAPRTCHVTFSIYQSPPVLKGGHIHSCMPPRTSNYVTFSQERADALNNMSLLLTETLPLRCNTRNRIIAGAFKNRVH